MYVKLLFMSSPFSITYVEDWRRTTGAWWAHVRIPDGDGGCIPAAPKPLPHKGYAILLVQHGMHELEFCSGAHLQHYITVLSKKLLPTTRQLSAHSGAGPNGHWLSRLPAEWKPYKKRLLLVEKLRQAAAYAAEHVPGSAFKS